MSNGLSHRPIVAGSPPPEPAAGCDGDVVEGHAVASPAVRIADGESSDERRAEVRRPRQFGDGRAAEGNVERSRCADGCMHLELLPFARGNNRARCVDRLGPDVAGDEPSFPVEADEEDRASLRLPYSNQPHSRRTLDDAEPRLGRHICRSRERPPGEGGLAGGRGLTCVGARKHGACLHTESNTSWTTPTMIQTRIRR